MQLTLLVCKIAVQFDAVQFGFNFPASAGPVCVVLNQTCVIKSSSTNMQFSNFIDYDQFGGQCVQCHGLDVKIVSLPYIRNQGCFQSALFSPVISDCGSFPPCYYSIGFVVRWMKDLALHKQLQSLVILNETYVNVFCFSCVCGVWAAMFIPERKVLTNSF